LPGLKGENLQDFFLRHGVAVHDGEIFGAPGWIRINIATQRDLLQQAFDRMSEAIDSLHLPTL
jgi:bifunctional pyridoxal-dependent enzyme with beta-cystathionase and maltose regulon repressor activities